MVVSKFIFFGGGHFFEGLCRRQVKVKEINIDLPFQCQAAKNCDVLQMANVTKLENTQKVTCLNPNFTLAVVRY